MSDKQDKLTNPLTKSDVINNLTTTTTNVPLSANQGKILNDKFSVMGKGNATSSTVSASTGTWTNGCYLTVPAGTYFVYAGADFPKVTGKVMVQIFYNNSGIGTQTSYFNNMTGNLHATNFITLTQNTNVYTRVYHASGATQSISTNISYIRLT